MVVRFVSQAVQSKVAYMAAANRGANRGGRGAPVLAPRRTTDVADEDHEEGQSDAWPSDADDLSSNGTGLSSGPVTDATSGDGGATPPGGDS
jgi:hypothetical protein